MNISGINNGLLIGVNKPEEKIKVDFSFKDVINTELEKLNNQQVGADKLTESFIAGEVDDLHTVMIATEEARLSLELAVQIRNKIVESYKEINNMQL